MRIGIHDRKFALFPQRWGSAKQKGVLVIRPGSTETRFDYTS